jgi:hypothetical protein
MYNMDSDLVLDANGKFTDETLCQLAHQDDMEFIKYHNDTQYKFSPRFPKAKEHNDTIDWFIKHGVKFEIVLQNSFKFYHDDQQFFYYSASKKWRNRNQKGPVYRSKGLDHVFEILRR